MTVWQAEGVLAQAMGLSIATATAVLYGHSAATRRDVREVAYEVVYLGLRIGSNAG